MQKVIQPYKGGELFASKKSGLAHWKVRLFRILHPGLCHDLSSYLLCQIKICFIGGSKHATFYLGMRMINDYDTWAFPTNLSGVSLLVVHNILVVHNVLAVSN